MQNEQELILQKHDGMKAFIASVRTTTVLAVVLSTALVTAQTQITPPNNSYTAAQDVQLGREASAQVRQELPIMRDDEVTSYVQDLGRRLVNAIPPELQHREFSYTFDVVNVREINAFALPGGPMFVNRGMIEAANTEGEVAGVMAHELSHVMLRHGTAQASKATKYQVGEVAGAILGSIIGGGWGQVISQGTQFGLGTAFLRYSREFERQADLQGAQLMARAGYDPRDMANMFKTIEKQGGSGGPQWLSDHPNPGNRYDYITQEAQVVRVNNPIRDTRAFDQVKSHLRRLPAAPTTEQATKKTGRTTRGGGGGGGESRPPTGQVAPPSSSYETYNEGNLFRVSVPSNWRELQDTNSVTFAPEGAYGSYNGQNVFTHGIEFGLARNESHDLQTATDELIDSLARGNPSLRRSSGYDRVTLADRRGLRTVLSNRSEATGQDEAIEVFTTQLKDGTLLYAIGVAPQNQFRDYRSVFDRVVSSLKVQG
jgi:beta-barrel assembly-enhancing protease